MRLRFVAMAIVLLTLLLAACEGSPSEAHTSQSTPTAPLSQHESTPTATTGGAQVGCASSRYFVDAQPMRIGDLLFALEPPNDLLSGGVQLPDAAPLVPYQVPGPYYFSLLLQGRLATASDADQFPSGYLLAVCNTSATQTHTLDDVYMRIDRLTPYTGYLNEFACGVRAYTRSQVPGGSGCGGGYDEHLRAVFPAGAAVGAVVATTDAGNDNNYSDINGYPPTRLGPLPATLRPHLGMVVRIEPALPSASATYVFSFGLGVDKAVPVYGPTSPPVLIAPAAREWTGDSCQAPAMQQRIPPASPTGATFYVCPPQT